MNYCKQCHKEIEEGRQFCSKSCIATYRNLLPENRAKSAERCRARNKTPEMREAAAKNMKEQRKEWEKDPRIKEIYREAHSKNMIKINKSQGMNKPKKSEDFVAELLSSYFINYEREKRVEFSDTRNSKGQIGGRYYRLDFYLPDYNIDLEVDGSIHTQEDQMEHDRIRDMELSEIGYRVYRIKFDGDYEHLKVDMLNFIHTIKEVG